MQFLSNGVVSGVHHELQNLIFKNAVCDDLI